MTTASTPPLWAEVVLRLFLKPDVFASVSGDLLEQYRDSIQPARGTQGADAWYRIQVLGYVLRGAGPWAALFAFAFVARTAFDWLWPTTDFHTRSQVSTALAIGIMVVAGFWTAWRSGSFAAGAVAGIATMVMAAALNIGGIAILFALWHDPGTIAAIDGSGGLEEAFVLPFFLVLPGVMLASFGGLLGAAARRLVHAG